MKWGLAMDGLESQITGIVENARGKFSPCTYIEIGVADGGTLCQVSKLLSSGKSWRSVGVELPEGYDFHQRQVEQNCTGQHLSVGFVKPNGWAQINPIWNRVTVVLTDVRDFFEGMWQEPIHLALIDGCHCKECVIRDFLNVEKYMPAGGTIMLHDFDPSINDASPHGGHCDVVGGCKELGLLDGREGWGLSRVLAADHSKGAANMLAITKEK